MIMEFLFYTAIFFWLSFSSYCRCLKHILDLGNNFWANNNKLCQLLVTWLAVLNQKEDNFRVRFKAAK